MKFIDKFRRWAIKNQTLLIIGSLVLLFAYFQNPSGVMEVTTQSIFGSTAGIFASLFGISVVIAVIGAILIPFPPTTIVGVIMLVVGGISSGFSFINTFNNIIPGIKIGTWGLIVLGALALYNLARGKGPKLPNITIKVPKGRGVDPQRVLAY